MGDIDYIKTRLRELYVEALRLPIAPGQVGDTDLIHTLSIDSLSSLEILIFAEEAFGVRFEDEDLSPELIDSIEYLAGYIRDRVAVPVHQPMNGEAVRL